ncbi:hypothetical protein KA005_82830, partial [bacterium]|nr:hypothetical protein [bacterium]
LDQNGDLISEIKIQSDHSESVNDLAFSPDGSLIATSSSDDTVHLIEVSSGKRHCDPLEHKFVAWDVIFSPDGSLLASVSGGDDTIRLWDPQTCLQVGELLTINTGSIQNIAFSLDGNILASVSGDYTGDGTIQLWNPSTGEQVGEPLSGDYSWNSVLEFSPDGQTILSSGDFIQLWNLETGQLREFDSIYLGEITAATFKPDGSWIASAHCLENDFGGSCVTTGIFLWDVETRELIGTFIERISEIHWLAFSPDGKKLFSSGCGPGEFQGSCEVGEIRSWDVDEESWIERACQIVGRNLTLDEWEQNFSDISYHVTCPQWSAGE